MEIKVDILTLTAVQLQHFLEAGVLTSVEAVKLYLAQISKHNHAGLHLNAIISVVERDTLLARAYELDEERSRGKVRGPFHGVPIILKDLCNTVDIPTTCGSYAFTQGRPKKDANLINTLKEAGLIILAMANLSELGNLKGSCLMSGWSAVGGQTQSPYIKGGVAKNATWITNTGPAGSSSGSAVAVAAGFAPVSLGTELDGSIMMPAARAGLYAIKLTPQSVDHDGFQPGAADWDSQGPYAKTVADIATLSAILQLYDPSYYQPSTTSWNGLKVGFVDPSLWRSDPTAMEPVEGFFNQTDNAMFAAQAKIEESGGKVARSVPVASWEDITGAMPDFSEIKQQFPKFLQLFEGVPQTLEELIKFNEDHADLEFTERDNNQKGLEAARDTTITEEQYDRNFKALRGAASHTLLSLMKEYDVDVLLGPCDSRFNSVGAAAGFPVGNLPLGFADFNGRPFSLHAIAPANEEAKIFQVMSAWEASFPDNVRPPPLLVNENFPIQQTAMEVAN